MTVVIESQQVCSAGNYESQLTKRKNVVVGGGAGGGGGGGGGVFFYHHIKLKLNTDSSIN